MYMVLTGGWVVWHKGEKRDERKRASEFKAKMMMIGLSSEIFFGNKCFLLLGYDELIDMRF